MERKGDRCTESSARWKDLLSKSVPNFRKSFIFKVFGIVFSCSTNGPCWVSSSETITVETGISQPNVTAILGKAIKLRKIANVIRLQIRIGKDFLINEVPVFFPAHHPV